MLSSDALSSVAYATDFILVTLAIAGTQALGYAIPISIVIASLLAIVAFSYRQTIHAYPTGGGAYIVAKENISSLAGLTAAASLLVDYTLTVAVSISAGVLAITSALPRLDVYRVEMCLAFLALLAIGNLRGIRESGRIFAVPTYVFVVSIGALIVAGLYQYRERRADAGRSAAPTDPRAADDVSDSDGVRQRLHGDDRRRSGVQRRPGLSSA